MAKPVSGARVKILERMCVHVCVCVCTGDAMTEEKIEADRTEGKRMGKLSRLARRTETEG